MSVQFAGQCPWAVSGKVWQKIRAVVALRAADTLGGSQAVSMALDEKSVQLWHYGRQTHLVALKPCQWLLMCGNMALKLRADGSGGTVYTIIYLFFRFCIVNYASAVHIDRCIKVGISSPIDHIFLSGHLNWFWI